MAAHGTALTAEQPAAHVTVRGDGAPLLMLHGWGATAALFDPVLPALRPGRRLIVPDLPGFGGTAAPPAAWSAHEYAAWTLALLDRLGVGACDVIGHSNGGRVAIVIAAEHPARVRHLVLAAGAGLRRAPTPRDRVRLRVYRGLRRAERAPWLPAVVRGAAHARAERHGSPDYRASAGVMRGTLVRLVSEDLAPLLPRVRAPTLLIWGDRDTETPLDDGRRMERLIPDAGLVVFEGGSHYAYLEQPGRFTHIVNVFLGEDGA